MNNAERVINSSRVIFCLWFTMFFGCNSPEPEASIEALLAVDVSSVQFSQEVEDARANADSFWLVSVDPEDLPPEFIPMHESVPTGRQGRRWRILGESKISEEKTDEVLHALKAGIVLYDEDAIPACFNPRHAIRIRSSGETIEIVICFECDQIEIFKHGKEIGGHMTADAPRAYFEQLVRDSGLPSPQN